MPVYRLSSELLTTYQKSLLFFLVRNSLLSRFQTSFLLINLVQVDKRTSAALSCLQSFDSLLYAADDCEVDSFRNHHHHVKSSLHVLTSFSINNLTITSQIILNSLDTPALNLVR